MKKNTLIIILIVIIVILSAVILVNREEEIQEEEVQEEEDREEISLKQVVYGFLETPYKLGPLGEKEGEEIYRTDVFDCTTLVLVSVSNLHSNEISPEERMKEVNYYPPEEVSFENRLHFSTYRNKVSPFFEDITKKVGGDIAKEKDIVLNKEREEGRIIDIDWEKKITLNYIEKEDVSQIIHRLPLEVGVAFMMEEDEKIGLDIRHEGFLFEKENFVHASRNKGKVVEENFLDFLEETNYFGVIFFKINQKL